MNPSSTEVAVTRGALLEIGMPHLAAAVSERNRFGIPFPTFAGSRYGFVDGSLTYDEFVAAGRAFMLGHKVHDPTAYIDPGNGGVECSVCDEVMEANRDNRSE